MTHAIVFASQVDRAHRQYILTQGPLENTAGHFWLMVWEQNCKAVLMLNKIIEKNHVKCHQYWPLGDSMINTMMFPDVGLKVNYVSKTESSDYTTRILKYEIDEESNCIYFVRSANKIFQGIFLISRSYVP